MASQQNNACPIHNACQNSCTLQMYVMYFWKPHQQNNLCMHAHIHGKLTITPTYFKYFFNCIFDSHYWLVNLYNSSIMYLFFNSNFIFFAYIIMNERSGVLTALVMKSMKQSKLSAKESPCVIFQIVGAQTWTHP